MIEVPFIGGSNETDSVAVSAQRTVNLYPQTYTDSQGTKTVMSLKHTPGLLLFATMSAGANKMRNLYTTTTGRMFACRGNGVAEFSTAAAETSRFVINTGATEPTSVRVRMIDNGVTMMLTDGTNGWTYNLSTNVATQISDADFPGGAFCDILDGYFLNNKPGTTLIGYSTLDDPTNWAALDTMSKEAREDHVTSFIVLDRRIWAFGSQSYGVFYHTEDSINPFVRFEGSSHDIGNKAPDSLAEDGRSVYWLGASAAGFGKVYKSIPGSYEAQDISPKFLEEEIASYTTTTDAEAYCYQRGGNEFYKLTFPTENKTWVYNSTNGMWHEESYRNTTLGKDERHRSRVHTHFNGKSYVGDHQNGNIYEISDTTYTDNGDTIIRERISPTHWNSLKRLKYSTMQLDIESGVGLDGTGQGTDPKIQIAWSNDGGRKFGADQFVSAGKIGEYTRRVKLNKLGYARDRVWRVRYSEPTPFTILSMFVRVK